MLISYYCSLSLTKLILLSLRVCCIVCHLPGKLFTVRNKRRSKQFECEDVGSLLFWEDPGQLFRDVVLPHPTCTASHQNRKWPVAELNGNAFTGEVWKFHEVLNVE